MTQLTGQVEINDAKIIVLFEVICEEANEVVNVVNVVNLVNLVNCGPPGTTLRETTE